MICFIAIDFLLFLAVCGKNTKKLYGFAMVMLFFVVAFRGLNMSGTDGKYYQMWFDYGVTQLKKFEFNIWIFKKTIQVKWEFGWLFTLIASISKSIVNSFECFQVIYTLLTFGLLYLIVNDLKLNINEKALFMLAYLSQQFVWYFCVLLRQNLANLLVWFALEHKFKTHNIVKKVIIIGLAILTHTSATICIVLCAILYFTRKIKLKEILFFSIGIGFGLYFGGKFLIPLILRFMASHIDNRYSMYIGRGGSSNIVNYFLRLIILIWFYKNLNYIKNPNKDKFIRIIALCFLVGSVNHALAVRMLEYLAIGNYYGIATSLSMFNGKN